MDYDLFNYLETIQLLDPNNEVDLFCLHQVFIPCINRHLESWNQAWIKHPMRSEHNLSPEQLWTAGLQDMPMEIATCISREVFEDLSEVSPVHFSGLV